MVPDVKIHYSNYFDTRKLVEKKMPEFLVIELLRIARKFHQRIQDIGRKKQDRGSSRRRIGQRTKWIEVLAKGGGNKKWFQYCLKPNDSDRLLYLRTIQGHSGKAFSGNAPIDPALQDNVLLPKDFTRCVCHIGSGKELKSMVNNGLIPGGFSTIMGRQAVFFTVVNPMDDKQGLGETTCDLSKARIAPYKNIWKRFQDTKNSCTLLLAQEKGLQFYQTRSNAVILYDTLPAECIEQAIRMVTTETLYEKESERPRVALRANFAMWIPRSTHTKGKIILGDAKRCTEFLGDRMQHYGLQNSRHINFNSSRAG